MSLMVRNGSEHITDEEALPPIASICSEVSESGCIRQVPSTSISLSTGPTKSGLSFTLDMDQQETTEHSDSLHDDIEKLFERVPEITLSDLLSSESECIPSDRGIEGADIPAPIADSRVLEEYDITSHRRSSFPHIHAPLKSLQSHSSKNLADEVEVEKAKKKKKSSKKPKKTKSVIFPSKSALLSPVIQEVEKEEYSEPEEDAQDAEDNEDENADETTKLLDDDDDEKSATSVSTGHKELSQPVLLLDTTDKKQTVPGHTDGNLADTGHILPFTHGGELDSNKSDLGFQTEHFHIAIGSEHTKFDAAPQASSFVILPELMAHDKTSKPLVSYSINEVGESPAFHGIHAFQDAVPALEAGSNVKFLLWEELEDGSNNEYKRISDDSSDEQNDANEDDDNEADNGNDGEEDENIATEGKDEDGETVLTFVTTTDGQGDTREEHKSTPSIRSKSRRHHHHENYGTEDLLRRRQRGSEVRMSNALRRVPTETDEAITLQSVDLDEMASHRMENLQGLRIHKIGRKKHQASSYMGKGSKRRKKFFKPKKTFDHSPHEVFVELDELYTCEDYEVEWREKARWIKFEEDVEEGAERWGKPHVASLSFHSLLELRKLLEAGSLLFDLEVTDFVELVHRICDNMVIHDQIRSDCKGLVMRTLLTKHKHQKHQISLMKTLSSASFNISSVTNIPALIQNYGNSNNNNQSSSATQGLLPVFHDKNNHGNMHDNMTSVTSRKDSTASKREQEKINKKGCPGTVEFVRVDVDNNMATDDGIHIGLIPKDADAKEPHTDQSLMRRIPRGAEACTVLVGCVDYLSKPTMTFVRLAEKQVFDSLTEVPVPVRFLFVLLGPSGGMDYHEVGRSISTLMSNQHFHEIAYKAEAQSEILHAINEFLNESIVLPPGDWDQKTLLPVMDMARKRAKMRRKRKEKEVQMKKDIPIDPLKRTGRPFGGLINDIRRRYPHYLSDFKDALSPQCVMALIFIFFACLCPCIAFGGLYAEKTHNKIGVVETILSTAITNLVFGLFSGQPLILYGATGPVLVFEKHLYSFCKESHIDFLTWRVWIGFWVLVITLLVLAFEGSFIVRYITRFTEEVFAILISLIFINEVIQKLVDIYKEHPLRGRQFYCDIMNKNGSDIMDGNASDVMNISDINTSPTTLLSILDISMKANFSNASMTMEIVNGYSVPTGTYTDDKSMDHEHTLYSDIMQPNTALLSTILVMGTFLIAYFLRIFRNSRFLGRSARRALGDFGIFTAIICMVVFDFLCADTYTQKLEIPNAFGHTDSSLGQWLVNPLGDKEQMPGWLIFMAVIPAFLFFLLLFLECQLTEMLLHKNEFKLRKGSGFHLDQFILGVITFLCALFGLPWMCPATVRSVAHVSALSVMSRTHAPGEKPKLVEVKDQRVTNIIMNILIGTTLFWGDVLRAVPMAVLFGVFLYLGVSAISGVQFYKRIKLLLIPVKHHPSASYVRHVKTLKMHIFTIIQLVMVMILWLVKSTIVAIAFPLFVFLMVPFRLKLMPKFFTHDELKVLDKEEEDTDDEEECDPDFYQMAHMPM